MPPRDPASTRGADVVWCDFGGVLTPPVEVAMANVVAATGVPWDALAAAASAVATAFGTTGPLAPLELGLCTQSEWGARVEAALPPGVRSRVPLGDFGTYWYAGRGAADARVLAALGRLRAAGIRIGLLTNSVAEWEPLRERMLEGVDVFDAVIRSHELGMAKPEPRILTHADRVLPPERGALLVDDSAANCAAARDHGWEAIEHTHIDSTVSLLRRLIPVAS